MRKEDQEKILTELESRVAQELITAKAHRLAESVEDTLYYERRRLKDDRSPAHGADVAFYDKLQDDLRSSPDSDVPRLVRRSVRHYAEEISGNFDERVYKVATRALPPALTVLLNAFSPLRLARRMPELPGLDEALVIQGETEQFRRLREKGTVILVPTHSSNLDSIVVGYALYRLGVPPFIYGAGLNLFSNPLISFFMHNLGAYTVDRRKTDPLYKRVLKEYATLSIEHGYDNIFFPGGTRSRSGAVERRLKLGLLGTGITAYANGLKAKRPQSKVFIVPCTLSYELVLEGETLIDDFLKEVGKSRYIIDDDEFARPKRVIEFMRQAFGLDAKIHVTFGRGIDPFGNLVDDEGHSVDPKGRTIDDSLYLQRDGDVVVDAQRDAEYTREVSDQIVESYGRNNVVAQTNVVAFAVMNLLRRANPEASILRILRTGGMKDDLHLTEVYSEIDRISRRLAELESQNKIRRAPSAKGRADDILSDALARFSTYHTRNAIRRKGDRLQHTDRNLILYYQNRLEGYGLSNMPCLTPDHRALETSV